MPLEKYAFFRNTRQRASIYRTATVVLKLQYPTQISRQKQIVTLNHLMITSQTPKQNTAEGKTENSGGDPQSQKTQFHHHFHTEILRQFSSMGWQKDKTTCAVGEMSFCCCCCCFVARDYVTFAYWGNLKCKLKQWAASFSGGKCKMS